MLFRRLAFIVRPPATSTDFDRAYRAPVTFWGDIRIPKEVEALVRRDSPRSSLELGCGVGRISRYLAKQGVRATGVDFSEVAIGKARERVSGDDMRPDFLVGDVTRLETLRGSFDVSFDVGCFHCLGPNERRAYVAEVARLLAPGATHLIWALDAPPSDAALSPTVVKDLFAPHFELADARSSRRRLARSHWYWLARSR